MPGEFPGSPEVKTPHFHYCGLGLTPGWGAKILQAAVQQSISACQKGEEERGDTAEREASKTDNDKLAHCGVSWKLGQTETTLPIRHSWERVAKRNNMDCVHWL